MRLTMRHVVALSVLTAIARCQVQLIYVTDVHGRYVPYNESGADCRVEAPPSPAQMWRPALMEISDGDEKRGRGTRNEDDQDEEVEQPKAAPANWGPGACVGGVPKQWAQIEAFNVPNPNMTSVVVSGGNLLSSDGLGGDGAAAAPWELPWELPVGFAPAVQAAVQYDVMGLGAAELSRGPDFLAEYLSSIKSNSSGRTQVLACNLQSSQLQDLIVHTSVIFNKSVAFVGFVDPHVMQDAGLYLDARIQLGNLSCVHEEAASLMDKQDKKTVVAVGSASSLARLKQGGIIGNWNIDIVVVAGLSEDEKANLTHSNMVNGTCVLALEGSGEFVASYLVSNGAVNRTQLNAAAADDEEKLRSFEALQNEVDTFYRAEVHSFHRLAADNCTHHECSVGDVISDAVLAVAFARGLVGARANPIAVWPGRNLTNDIPAGNLTVEQLYQLLPDEPVALATASGSAVTAMFARAVAGLTEDFQHSDAFLQVSGVRVTYDLDLDEQFRARYLMNLCFECSPQEYHGVSPQLNYTILLPVSMLQDNLTWSDVTQQFGGHILTGYTARDAVSALAGASGFLRAPAGGRIGYTHFSPDAEPAGNTFVTVLVTMVACMAVFGLLLVGFRAWSSRNDSIGSLTHLLR